MTIFLDMDGVVSDLAQGMCKLFNMTYEEFLQKQPKTWGIAPVFGIPYEEMWGKVIPSQPASFYGELPEYPWARTLYAECKKRSRTVFLTAPVNCGSCLAGKYDWLCKFTGDPKFKDYIIANDKEFCSKPDCILIDDKPKNCEKFREAGGKAVLFPNYGNENREIFHSGVGVVESVMAEVDVLMHAIYLNAGGENEPMSEAENRVLQALRKHKASPFFELATLSRIDQSTLKSVILSLQSRDLVKVSHPRNPFTQIITLKSSALEPVESK